MRQGFRVCDADTHQIEPRRIWQEYLEPAFRDRGPSWALDEAVGRELCTVEGEVITSEAGQAGRKFPGTSPAFMDHAEGVFKRKHQAAIQREFDPASRLEAMDGAGVDVQILYPTTMAQLLGREWRDPELFAAVCRAYNDWTRQYCDAAPERLRWSAVLPLEYPDLAVEELRRVTAMGAVSCFVRPNPTRGRNLYHADFDPLWAAVEAADLPLSIHDSASPLLPSFGERMDTHDTGHILSHPFEAMATVVGLIWFGVFERFPALQVVHVEADAGWVPFLLRRMEQRYEYSGAAEHPELQRNPVDYFHRNVVVATRGDEPLLPAAVQLVGDDAFVFNSDYPHADGSWPTGLDAVLEQPIPDESKRKILWDNAARAFRLEGRLEGSAVPG